MKGTVKLVRVVDGDTIKVRTSRGSQNIRLIGVDAPENSSTRYGRPDCGGPQATAYLRKLLRGRSTLRLRRDPSQDEQDRYGRPLRYASAGGVDLGRQMITGGWAAPYVYAEPFSRLGSYRQAAKAARKARRGVWRDCRGRFHAAR